MIYIKGCPPQRMFSAAKHRHTKQFMDFVSESWMDFKENKDVFQEAVKDLRKPYMIAFHVVRSYYTNVNWPRAANMMIYMMQKHKWIRTVTHHEIIPFPLLINKKCISVSKMRRGTIIKPLVEPPSGVEYKPILLRNLGLISEGSQLPLLSELEALDLNLDILKRVLPDED